MPVDDPHDPAQGELRLEALRQENESLKQELHMARLAAGLAPLRAAFEQSRLAYQSLDAQGRLRLVSRGWQELFGVTEAQALGRPFGDFVAPEQQPSLARHFRILVEEGSIKDYEILCLRPDGTRFTVRLDGMALPGPDGNFFCTYCLLRDVTAETLERRVLKESESFYRSVFDNAALPIAIARDLKILYANAAMAGILRLDNPRALIGTDVLSYLPPREQELFRERALRRARGEAVANQYETVVLRPDGSGFPALSTVSLIELPDGPATIGFFQDISDQKRMADSLSQSESRFRRLFDAVPAIAVQGYDQQRTVIYWNQASGALYGYSPEEALGRKLEDLIIPPAMREGVVEAVRAWVEEGVVIPSGELVLMHKDGSPVPVFSSHVMQRLGDGSQELYCLDVDLRELAQAKQELTRARDAAEAANKAKSEFLANMSHEIRTPMNGVLGMLQLLMDSGLEGEQLEFAGLALQSSRRLLTLLNDILDFSRIESGSLPLNLGPLRLQDLLESVRRVFSVTAEKNGLELTAQVSDSPDVQLLADEARLRQILFNLVGNALKFTKSGGVRMEAWIGPEPGRKAGLRRLHLCVSDSGPGIDPQKIHLMFERFTQSDGSYTRQHEGAGLGLAIVKRIVALLGGNIVVDSATAEGTSIVVSLPLRVGHAQAAPAVAAAIPASPSLAVLVAEDDRISQMFMRELLLRLGHRVTVVSNGAEAVRAAAQEAFDCVLMDVQMPLMNGLDATRAIRDEDALRGRPRVRIIALTAYAMAGDREKFLAAGMDDYLSKPVQDQELARILRAPKA